MPCKYEPCVTCGRYPSKGSFCPDTCRYLLMDQSPSTPTPTAANGSAISFAPALSTIVMERRLQGRSMSRIESPSSATEWCQPGQDLPLRTDISTEDKCVLKAYENYFDKLRAMKRQLSMTLWTIQLSKVVNTIMFQADECRPGRNTKS